MNRDQQVQFIKQNYLKLAEKEMAKRLGRSGSFVRGVMKKERLIVPEKIILERKKKSQFKKGQQAFNKGKKQSDFMTEDKIALSSKTRFKSGSIPHNTKYDGHISIRESKGFKYAWIRIEKARYVLLHRHIYQLNFGPIPNHINVQFKDGNTLNCHPENLYTISRPHQARINKLGGKEIPVELHQSLLLIQDLKKLIYEKQN
jgi:hypothetical protein